MEVTGKELRDRGMAQIESGTPYSEKMIAKLAIRDCYQMYPPSKTWTTDEVHKQLSLKGYKLVKPRVLGPLMKRAAKAGLIEPVMCGACKRQETKLSTRPERHAGPQYLWRSTTKGYYEYPFFEFHDSTKSDSFGTAIVPGTYDDAFWNMVDLQIKQGKGE